MGVSRFKRRKELDKSWSGLFRHKILQALPVNVLRKYYHSSNGRPSKELYSMLGLMILQQMHDLTDDQAVEQFAFNIKYHYALDITDSSDTHSYVSLRSIWKMRQILVFRKQGMTLQDAYYNALKTTGKAVAFTGITLAISVCTWTFSSIKFQADMGILLAFMFIWNMVGALIVMPALVYFLGEPKAVKQAALLRKTAG